MPRPSAPAPRRRENTRARLVEASEAVFAEKGLKRVTVDDLVGAAGFTRGAFYSNFSSIDEVFFTVFEQLSEQMLATVRAVIDGVPEGEFTLESLTLVFERLKPIGPRWYVIQAEFTLLALRSPEAREVFKEHRQRFESQMVELIGDVVTLLGREPLLPLDQMTETAIALYLHALGQDGLGIGTLGTDELVASVLPQVIVGLSRERS
ncbi:MAG: TetR/AcrR family transcriptional regulator [Nocardioidaceae bacterium]